MGLVRLRFEAQQRFLEAVRSDDPAGKKWLMAEGHSFSRLADEEARRIETLHCVVVVGSQSEEAGPKCESGLL